MKNSDSTENGKNTFYLPLIIFFVTIITRIPFTSKFLYHLDSVHFALALEKYDITTHQPHPPGYFLYVMLGRLLNLFIGDANTVFVTISIIFSGLTVVAIYYLGKEMFDRKTGIIAALFAIASPNMWFHGEVALTYIVEAFFSALIAFLCWRIYKGEHKYLWLSVIVLGIAGGIRQNTLVFLFPLWLFSIKGMPLKKIIASFALLGIVCLSWFIPMIQMAGGYEVYREAFRELWLFNTGYESVFDKGLPRLKLFSLIVFRNTLYGLGAGILILGLAAYSIARHKRLKTIDNSKTLFFAIWILPSFMFYLFIFIHPANPGYVLIFIPALLLLTAASVSYMAKELLKINGRDYFNKITVFIISINTLVFLFSNHIVSYNFIKNHDRDLKIMLNEFKAFDPLKTAFFALPYVYYGYRHIMYYLPQYRVYQVDVRVAPTGEIRKTWWSINKETFLTDKIVLPKNIENFSTFIISDSPQITHRMQGISIKKLEPTNMYIISGHISLVREIFPELKAVLQQ